MKPLSLAYFTSQYARASDTFIRNEVRRLRELGHTVHTFSQRRPDESQIVSDFIRSEYENTDYILPDRKIAMFGSCLKMLLRKPGRWCEALRLMLRTRQLGVKGLIWHTAYFLEGAYLADRMLSLGVEHLHNHLGDRSATVAMLASTMSGVPFSMAIHGPYIFRAPEEWALGEKIDRSAFTTVITDFTRSQCMIYAPQGAWGKLKTVRCAVDDPFLEGEPPELPDNNRFFWVGRICAEKGVEALISAAQVLAEEGRQFELVLGGDGEMRPHIEAMIHNKGLGGHVKLLGWIGSEDVRRELTGSSAMIAPSFAEGLPVVIMESLAMGRPVVSTYIAGIPELVRSRENGWVIPAGSVDALVSAMRELMDTPRERRVSMGMAGRKRVRERHCLEREVAKLEALIRASVSGEALPDA
ncbi:MAG: glycosyltransferase family 4 protein [Planctomycetota bacterium]|jgi:glycosyltransferase involved in cell wall biosynthesis